jgi:hypothetical protein
MFSVHQEKVAQEIIIIILRKKVHTIQIVILTHLIR